MSEQDLGSRPILYEAFPRGLCAGVIKAVTESEDYIAQKRAGDPSARIFYVGFPAHNTHINNRFRDNGVTFVTDVSEAESGGSVIFGPHGSTDKDIEIAKEMGMEILDTECPLVTKVKEEIKERTRRGIVSLYHGKNGHAETRAAMSAGDTILFETEQEAIEIASRLISENPNAVAGYAGQTTHNVDRSKAIAEKVRKIIPSLEMPNISDQCFATRDRQEAAREMVRRGAEAIVIVGSPESSNSRELTEVVKEEGAKAVFFVDSVEDFDVEKISELKKHTSFGLEAGASVEENVIAEVRSLILKEGNVQRIEDVVVADEIRIRFKHSKIMIPPYNE